MSEKAPVSNQETKETSDGLVISLEQKNILLDYLKNSSDDAINEDLEVASLEDEKLAEQLLSLKLPSADWEKNRHSEYTDSNYTEDEKERDEAMQQAGLGDVEGLKIRRHNISIENLNIKIINLRQEQEILSEKDIKEIVGVNVPGGVIFVGKLIFSDGEPVYTALDEDSRAKLYEFLTK